VLLQRSRQSTSAVSNGTRIVPVRGFGRPASLSATTPADQQLGLPS
jgi:hypothetical protein